MVYLEINATIADRKMLEFSQAKMIFIENLQHIDGSLGFTEKPGDKFQMKITWTTRKLLDKFMKSEEYRIFHGAIVTLSEANSTQILKEGKVSTH